MNDRVTVVDLLLTARAYETTPELDEGDLPPSIRTALWDGEGVERPVQVTESAATEATGVADPWDAISDLLFTHRETFAGTLELVDEDLAAEWYLDRVDADRLRANPALAYAYGDRPEVDGEVDYEAAREANRPVRADRAWIDGLLAEYFDEDDEEDEEMLDLVEIRAPSEIELTLDDLVLTDEQAAEIQKIAKAIKHRDYLAQIGLREIGKLLFVGPPGTGKTSTARALAHDLDLPVVEVKLSMITSQYLGETAKNVEKVFEVATRLSPCILFIDEFDFVAKTRTSDEHAAIKRAVNTLLKSIDEVSLIQDDVLLIGATNHPDQLDTAAWRRFDEILEFPRPDESMRADILQVITREMDIDEFDPRVVAAATEGLTGSDLRLVLREAVLEALVDDRRTLTQDDLLAAVEEFEERDNLKRRETLDEVRGTSDRPESTGSHGQAADDGHDHAAGGGHDHADHDDAGGTEATAGGEAGHGSAGEDEDVETSADA
ncbi:MAG: ATP-binding protein [Halobacteriaceae archaeon]